MSLVQLQPTPLQPLQIRVWRGFLIQTRQTSFRYDALSLGMTYFPDHGSDAKPCGVPYAALIFRHPSRLFTLPQYTLCSTTFSITRKGRLFSRIILPTIFLRESVFLISGCPGRTITYNLGPWCGGGEHRTLLHGCLGRTAVRDPGRRYGVPNAEPTCTML